MKKLLVLLLLVPFLMGASTAKVKPWKGPKGVVITPAQRKGPPPTQRGAAVRAGTPAGFAVGSRHNARKICQLLYDTDWQTGQPTLNQSSSRAYAVGADLGVVAMHAGRPYIHFGDTYGRSGSPPTDTDIWGTVDYGPNVDPEQCIHILWAVQAKTGPIPGTGLWQPMSICPTWCTGIGGYGVPLDAFDDSGKYYLVFARTLQTSQTQVATSTNDGFTWTTAWDWENGGTHFINVSIDQDAGYIYFFGTGTYREGTQVFLARAPQGTHAMDSSAGVQYMTATTPTWGSAIGSSAPLFTITPPYGYTTWPTGNGWGLGEISVRKIPLGSSGSTWLMLYNCYCDNFYWGAGITMRTAPNPWGPWSPPQPLVDLVIDKVAGYWVHNAGGNYAGPVDSGNDPNGPSSGGPGGLYGPYILPMFTKQIDANTTRIYFTLSTWNPYNSMLVSADLTHY